MKKVVYLAPLALLSVGAKASANQVPTHISNALRIYEQENQPIGQSENEQSTQQVKPSFPNGQNKPVGKGEETTHINRLDSGLIDEDSSVGNNQTSQVMKISRPAIPTKQELSESKESVAGQYVQVQQNRVAQFNNGSKIYGLNNSGQLSKNNGDGYVITNAGTYNGRAVDIGVTINNVSEQQGNYTTKWSNGDKADVKGVIGASFKYDNSVLTGVTNDQVSVPKQTRERTENKTNNVQLSGFWVVGWLHNTYDPNQDDGSTVGGLYTYESGLEIIDPALIKKIMEKENCSEDQVLAKLGIDTSKLTTVKDSGPWWCNDNGPNMMIGPSKKSYVDKYYLSPVDNVPDRDANNPDYPYASDDRNLSRNVFYHVSTINDAKDLDTDDFVFPCTKLSLWPNNGSGDYLPPNAYPTPVPLIYSESDPANPSPDDILRDDSRFNPNIGYTKDNTLIYDDFKNINYYSLGHYGYRLDVGPYGHNVDLYGPNLVSLDHGLPKDVSISPITAAIKQNVQVTDTLQLDQVNNGSLNYDYTIGVYDAQTGELIKDLTAKYKGKTGKAATDQDIAMNNAVKAKIQAINANQANSAYTGTAANDDITFNKNTVHVNYVDTRGESINVPGYDIDVDNLTSGNYQVPQNYVLVNTNGFKVTKNTHEVNGVTVTDSYNFIDQGNNKVTDNGRTLNVVLTHGTKNVDPIYSNLSNDATNNIFAINNGAKRQINSQSRHFGAAGVLDLVTNKITKQGDWLLLGKSNFDQTNINNDLVGYGNAIHNNLTFLAL